jgi:hypothetical protein
MTTATITPLRSGAVLECGGHAEHYKSFAAAQDEADARGLQYEVARFPNPPVELWRSPALKF